MAVPPFGVQYCVSAALYITVLGVLCLENAHTRTLMSPQRRTFANIVVKDGNQRGVGQHIGKRVWQSKQLKVTNEAWKPFISTREASQHLLQKLDKTTQIHTVAAKRTHTFSMQKRLMKTQRRSCQTTTPRRLLVTQ